MNVENLLSVLKTLQQGKELPRQGMILNGLKLSEVDTVASHSYTVTVFSYILAKELSILFEFIDPLHIMEIALFHDLPEILTGDIGRNVKINDKALFNKIEIIAANLIDNKLSNNTNIQNLIESYNAMDSYGSWIVKVADLLDALIYYNSGYWQLKHSEDGLTKSENKFIQKLNSAIASENDTKKKEYYNYLKIFFENAVELIKSNQIKRLRL